MVKKCCGQEYLKVGYIRRPKNEIYICPNCGLIQFSPSVGKIKQFFLRFVKDACVYDENQVRLYFPLGRPTVIADNTGEQIRKIEEGLEEIRNEEKFS